jgi:hypothetical protein
MAEKTVGGFMNDLKKKNLLDIFRKADEGLSNDIIVEIRLAGGSKKDVPTNHSFP